MLPEERELLNRSVLLAEDNNKILHSIKRSMIWGRIMSFIYWVFIIGSAIGAYYFLEPYYNKVMNVYSSVSGAEQKINSKTSVIQDLFNKF